MSTKFYFLEDKYTKLFLIAKAAEEISFVDTSSCLTKCRLFGEEMVKLIESFENLNDDSKPDFFTKIKDLKSKKIIPRGTNKYLHILREYGNIGAHNHLGKEDNINCNAALETCYSLSQWFVYTYDKVLIEDNKYENLFDESVSIDVSDSNIENAPSYDGNMQIRIAELNKDEDEIKERRKRSKKLDKKLFALGHIIGIGAGGAAALLLVGVSPVGLAVGLASGIGLAVYRYRGKFKSGKDD